MDRRHLTIRNWTFSTLIGVASLFSPHLDIACAQHWQDTTPHQTRRDSAHRSESSRANSSPVNALMRWVGFGYSDGYHSSSNHPVPPVDEHARPLNSAEWTVPKSLDGNDTYTPAPAAPQPSTSPPKPRRSESASEPLQPPKIELPPSSQRSPSDLPPPATESLPAPPRAPQVPLPIPPVVDPDAPTSNSDPMQTRRRPYWWTR